MADFFRPERTSPVPAALQEVAHGGEDGSTRVRTDVGVLPVREAGGTPRKKSGRITSAVGCWRTCARRWSGPLKWLPRRPAGARRRRRRWRVSREKRAGRGTGSTRSSRSERALRELDAGIERIAETERVTAPLVRYFLFLKEAIFGADVAGLAGQTAAAYADLERLAKLSGTFLHFLEDPASGAPARQHALTS